MKNSVKKTVETVETVNINVNLIQKDAKLLIANNLEFTNIQEISEKISIKILTLRANLKRFNKSIKGFSFNRKFTIEIEINGEKITFNDLFAGLDNFSITLATNEKAFYNFAAIIYDLISSLLNRGDKVTINEILNKQNTLLLA